MMSNLEHYFENILYDVGLYDDDPNMELLTKEEIEAVRICASYILYTQFCDRERFLKFAREYDVDPIDCIDIVKQIKGIIATPEAVYSPETKYYMICNVMKGI